MHLSGKPVPACISIWEDQGACSVAVKGEAAGKGLHTSHCSGHIKGGNSDFSERVCTISVVHRSIM